MFVYARLDRRIIFVLAGAASVVAGCSGNSTTPCNYVYVGSAGAISGVQVSPASGATSVPTGVKTLVFNELGNYSIVLEAIGGASSGAIVRTTPTALPSPYVNPPGFNTSAGGTNGYYAVSVPALDSATTYASGTLSDDNRCAGDNKFYRFGTFTTQ